MSSFHRLNVLLEISVYPHSFPLLFCLCHEILRLESHTLCCSESNAIQYNDPEINTPFFLTYQFHVLLRGMLIKLTFWRL